MRKITILLRYIDEVDGSETHLSVTAEHPFYHAERGWVHTSKLVVGDTLIEDDGGTLRVTEVLFNPNSPLNVTYNLEVSDFHTYFVGADGVLVHNGDLKRRLRQGLYVAAQIGRIIAGADADDRTKQGNVCKPAVAEFVIQAKVGQGPKPKRPDFYSITVQINKIKYKF